MSERFVPSTLDGFKRKVKHLRSLIGKNALKASRSYEIAARVCGYRNWYELNRLLKTPTSQLTIWDEDLDHSELKRRHETQVLILMEEAGVARSEAERVLDIIRISSREGREVATPQADVAVSARVDALMVQRVEPKPQSVPSISYRKRRALVTKAVP